MQRAACAAELFRNFARPWGEDLIRIYSEHQGSLRTTQKWSSVTVNVECRPEKD